MSNILKITLRSQQKLGHNVYKRTLFFIILNYLQLNKTSLSCSRSDSNILQCSGQILFVSRFALHSNTLFPPLPIEITFGRCIWYVRSNFSGIIIISSGFFRFLSLQSESSLNRPPPTLKSSL